MSGIAWYHLVASVVVVIGWMVAICFFIGAAYKDPDERRRVQPRFKHDKEET